MKLEDIGFYTLSNKRSLNSNETTPLERCELVLTSRCNFRCEYCRGMKKEYQGDLPTAVARNTLNLWMKNGLRNVRFSGGEPLMYRGLLDLVKMCKDGGVKRIAISSNGSFPTEKYIELILAGVNDLSISLDSGCCSVGEKMSGGVKGWTKVVENIKLLSKLTYISAGMVFTEVNVDDCLNSVLFAHSLGVSDIRVIPSAQYNKALIRLADLPEDILNKYPILRYRINNIKNGVGVRGMKDGDCSKCYVVLDDVMSAGEYHFPCIIYFREGGKPIGKMDEGFRSERKNWHENHNVLKNPICSKNCLDCLVKYNNYAKLHRNK